MLPPSSPRMLNLPKQIKPCSTVLLHGKAVKIPPGRTETLRAPYFQVPGAEMFMSIWYQATASRKHHICSAHTVQTAFTFSVKPPRQDVSHSQHTAQQLDVGCAEMCSTSTQCIVAQHIRIESIQYF